MKWLIDLFSSSLGRKVVMALTGLFIILFLTVHLIGNLQLLKNDGGEAFNVYAYFMTHNPLIKTVSYVNYAFFVFHIVWAIMLTRKNRSARGAEGYAITNTSTIWSARNMGILGTVILVFLVIHMRQFWGEMHFGTVPFKTYGDLCGCFQKLVVCGSLQYFDGGHCLPLMARFRQCFPNSWN
jgi:succinate dehydrogenase / fumarate reductase cytochrome b subunit